MMTELIIRPLRVTDHAQWQQLYRGYRDFYNKPHDPVVYERLWLWLHEQYHQSFCIVAELDGKLVGLAHYRLFARPIDAAWGVFLDDLFTDPAFRGKGIATALLKWLANYAAAEDATMVRWITAQDNGTARSLYDKVATQTPWVTYDLSPAKP